MPLATRDRLVDAAWDCVRQGGLSGATSRAITSAAGANLGAINYYFGSKEALLAETVGAAIERLVRPAVEALQDPDVDPVSRVLTAVARLQKAYAESADDAPAYLEVLVQSRRQPLLQARVGRLFTDLRSVLAALMHEQQGRGFLPAWVEPEPMAALLLAVAQGVVLQGVIDGDGPPQTSIADQFAQLLMAARPGSH
jgi:AcrR family transcriptional regulator